MVAVGDGVSQLKADTVLVARVQTRQVPVLAGVTGLGSHRCTQRHVHRQRYCDSVVCPLCWRLCVLLLLMMMIIRIMMMMRMVMMMIIILTTTIIIIIVIVINNSHNNDTTTMTTKKK